MEPAADLHLLTQEQKEYIQRLEAAVKAVDGIIWTNTADGQMFGPQEGWTALTGQTESEYSGYGWSKAVHPDDGPATIEAWEDAVKHKKPFIFEHRLLTVNKGWRTFKIKAIPLMAENGSIREWVGVHMDITEQREAENAIKESEMRFRAMADASPVMIWTLDAQGNSTYYNLNALEFTGHTQKDLASGKSWQMAIHPDDIAYAGGVVQHAVQNQLPYQMECRMQRADGEWRYLLNNGTPRFGANGEMLGYVGSSVDITERRQAEEKLAKSEKYFRELTDTLPAIVWMTRPDGYCTYLNKNWYEYTGQTPGEAEGFGWVNATHPDDSERAEMLFKEASAQQKPYFIIYRLRHHTGVYRWAIDSGEPKFSPDGKFEGMYGTVIDIHEQKIAEDEIRNNEQKFRTLAESLPQLIWMTDAHGNQEYASQRWKEYTGIEPTGSESWTQIVHTDDLGIISQAWERSLRTGEKYLAEVRLKSMQGDYKWHFVHGEPVRNDAGEILKWIGSFTNIHDRKTLTEELESVVQERTKDLQRSNEDLQQFAHVASHDLKEPVRKIKTFANRLESEVGVSLPERGQKYLEKIHVSADRMHAMIDGVLTYSTLNAEGAAIQEVDLTEVLHSIESDLEMLFELKRAHLDIGPLPHLQGASVLLYQLFYNLINNSLKFSREDGLQIDVSCKTLHFNGQEYAEITLRDNGIGFEPKFSERIFKTFERLHSREHYEGTGLGLSLCKKIAERHGGSIRAEGRENEGATFIVTLPVKQSKNTL